jgi:fumarate hydratase subunit beta
MSTVHELALPLTEDQVRKLRVGDLVYLSGEIIMTAGMPTHQRMLDFIERLEPLPLDLNGQVLLQFGGYQREVDGKMEVVYINPTTSTRFNPYMPSLIRGCRLRAVGGKGGLDAASARAMQEVGCVYLSFPGGGCTLYSNAIREVVAVEWRDLLLHYRLTQLRVDRLGPGTVAIDAHGHSLYDSLQSEAEKRLPDILAQLKKSRENSPL